jgi:hypothetical protein
MGWVGYGQLPAGWSYDASQGMYIDPMGMYKETYESPFGSAGSEGQYLQSLGLGQYVNQVQTPDGTQWNVQSGAPTPYMGYDPRTGQIVVDAFDSNGNQVGTPFSYTDDKGGWAGPLIELGAAALTGYGIGSYALGADAASGAGGAGGAGGAAGAGGGSAATAGGAGAGAGSAGYSVGTLGASDLAPVGASVDAGAIGGVDGISTVGGAGAAGAGTAGAGAGAYTTAAADSQAANAALGLGANSGSVPAAVDLGSAGGVMSTGGSGLSNGLSNWWNKASHGDLGAIRSGVNAIGALSSLFQHGHAANSLTPQQLRDALLGPYNSFNPTQQAAVQSFFNSPIRGPYVPPNVNGVVQLTPQTGLPPLGALTAYGSQPGHATIQPVPGNSYASGGSVCGALGQYAAGGFVPGASLGQADNVPSNLSHGEYVMDADVVSALGDGNNAAGAKRLDEMRQAIRAHKRSAPNSEIPPKAKAPLQYLKGTK